MVEQACRHKEHLSMNRIVILVIVLLFAVSCGTTRKAVESAQSVISDSTTTTQDVKTATNKTIDTTRTEHGKITITEIEFFPVIPDAPPIANDTRSVDSCGHTAKSPAQPNANVDLQNVGKFNGAVKSIKQTVIESDIEAKGKSDETKEQEQSKSNAIVSRQESEVHKQQEPAPDPYRWRYIFYVGLLLTAVLLYLKRAPILNWIKKILSGLRKIF